MADAVQSAISQVIASHISDKLEAPDTVDKLYRLIIDSLTQTRFSIAAPALHNLSSSRCCASTKVRAAAITSTSRGR
jgi:hypothetical protein